MLPVRCGFRKISLWENFRAALLQLTYDTIEIAADSTLNVYYLHMYMRIYVYAKDYNIIEYLYLPNVAILAEMSLSNISGIFKI